MTTNGIARSVEKHTQQSVFEYNGNARPGELVVDLTTYQLYIGNAEGDLNLVAGSGGSPGGATTQVQFNDIGSFSGSAGLTYDKTTSELTVAGNLLTSSAVIATGNVAGGNLTTVGAVTTGTLAVTGESNLNAVGNVTITGGTSGQVLTTNGVGGLTWDSPIALVSGTSSVAINSGTGDITLTTNGTPAVVISATSTAVTNGLFAYTPLYTPGPAAPVIFGSYSQSTLASAFLSSRTPTSGLLELPVGEGNKMYFQGSPTVNYNFNIGFVEGSSAKLNDAMTVGSTLDYTAWVKQGAIARTLSGLYIDGIAQTLSVRTDSTVETANTLTQYQFQITKTADATFIVLLERAAFSPAPTY